MIVIPNFVIKMNAVCVFGFLDSAYYSISMIKSGLHVLKRDGIIITTETSRADAE